MTAVFSVVAMELSDLNVMNILTAFDLYIQYLLLLDAFHDRF